MPFQHCPKENVIFKNAAAAPSASPSVCGLGHEQRYATRCDNHRRNRHAIHRERNTLGHCNTFGRDRTALINAPSEETEPL